MIAAQCRAITKGGSRCRSPVLPGSPHCLMHAPERAALRREAGRKGGAARANAVRAAKQLPPALTSSELLAVLSRAIGNVEAGALEPGRANAMAALARAMSSIRETSEVEARLRELEARAGVRVDRRFA